jgi:hypothetical protein
MMVFCWKRYGLLMVSCGVLCGVFMRGGEAQTTSKPKSSTSSSSKAGMAVWSPDVQQTLGVSQENFNAEGLNKLTKMQLVALETSARIDPKKGLLTCPVSGTMPAGRIHVFVTVDGDDASMAALAEQVRQAVAALNGVDVVQSAAQADRALHVVIQTQTTGRGLIGYTASYVTATPCVLEKGGKKTDVELKGTLAESSANSKGDGLAQTIATMLDHDLTELRSGVAAK